MLALGTVENVTIAGCIPTLVSTRRVWSRDETWAVAGLGWNGMSGSMVNMR